MRASDNSLDANRHLSGAERLVSETDLQTVTLEMLARAREKSPTSFQINAEAVEIESCQHIPCLAVHTVISPSPDEAAEFAKKLLINAGVSAETASNALLALRNGLGYNGAALRGASLWDKDSGKRLERDPARGVRASRFDYSLDGAVTIGNALEAHGLTHFRTREALALAAKAIWSGVSAELCWSDEPEYTTGYVSTKRDGYVRIPGFKPSGAAGGRIFFVDQDQIDVESLENRLQTSFTLIEPPISISDPIAIEEFIFNL